MSCKANSSEWRDCIWKEFKDADTILDVGDNVYEIVQQGTEEEHMGIGNGSKSFGRVVEYDFSSCPTCVCRLLYQVGSMKQVLGMVHLIVWRDWIVWHNRVVRVAVVDKRVTQNVASNVS